MRHLLRKREKLARVASALGLTRFLECVGRRPILLVLNYHRIGNPGENEFDPALFSVSAEYFDAQVRLLREQYRIVSLAEALKGLATGFAEPSILITFDDGYLDNYEVALPILKRHGVPATFFLPTAYVGTNRLPWWDAIAYMLRKSLRPMITIGDPDPVSIDLTDYRLALRTVLRLYKLPAMSDPERFFAQVSEATGVEPPQCAPKRLFLSWADAQEMVHAGMDIGSHTHTHSILGRMTLQQQKDELAHSKEMIRRHAGYHVTALSYPVGNPTTFSNDTFRALAANGYTAAFSFYGGVNIPGSTPMFNIKRVPVNFGQSLSHVRLMVSSMVATGRSI